MIEQYPTHGFVIDVDEAKDLFNNVSQFDATEDQLFRLFKNILRIQGEELIVDLEQVFTAEGNQDNEEAELSSEPSTHADDNENKPLTEQTEPSRGAENGMEPTSAAPSGQRRPDGEAA